MPTHQLPPDWPTVGARVAEHDNGIAPNIVTVARKTDTQIVTSGPRRYYRTTLKAVGDQRGFVLRPLTDPDVVHERTRAALEHVANEAERISRRTRESASGYGPNGFDRSLRLGRDDATAAYRAALHDIRDLVAVTLAALDDTAEHTEQCERCHEHRGDVDPDTGLCSDCTRHNDDRVVI